MLANTSAIAMANNQTIKTSLLKTPDQDTIQEMIHIYQEAFKNDSMFQLENTVPQLIERLSETIALRIKQSECEFIIAKTEDTTQVVGWLALTFKLEDRKQLSEEHILYAQYALLPDIVAKAKAEGVHTEAMKIIAHKLFTEFKEARELHLPEKHCVISALVVQPEYQNKGVASALLAKAISLTEVFSFPIWVQVPDPCQSIFKNHLFEEVGKYQLKLSDHIPEQDSSSTSKGKGKTKAVSASGEYNWKFMVRKKPLEGAIQAYKSSKMYAEEHGTEEEAQLPAPAKDKEGNWISKAFRKYVTKIGETEHVLGGDVQTATEDSVTTAGGNEGVGESTPLLTKQDSKGEQGSGAKDKAAR